MASGADGRLSRGDRLTGALVGLALGDALGAPVEALPPTIALEYVETVVRPGLTPLRGPAGFPFGQVTDDTQLAVELLRTLAERGGFEPATFAARIASLVGEERLVGGGPATRATAGRLAQGVPWDEAGMAAPYAGNGAAMRAAPLGVVYHDLRRLQDVVVAQARVTHQAPCCAAGAMAIAGAAAIAARQEPISPAIFLAELGSMVAPVDPGFAGLLLAMPEWSLSEPEEAVQAITERSVGSGVGEGWLGISSGVAASVCWSLYAFLRSPEDFSAAVCDAIAVGGDTDSMAAMTGGIVGARMGIGALPAQPVARLTDRGAWTADELIQLSRLVAHRLGL